jgi:DNA-binding response OmpR family regulator
VHALIVEDDVLTAFMLKDMLSALGFTSFDLAGTEATAIALAARRLPDLITADVRLEEGTGAGAVRAICRDQSVPVIFITGNPEAIKMYNGAVVLIKPVGDAALRAAVERICVRTL